MAQTVLLHICVNIFGMKFVLFGQVKLINYFYQKNYTILNGLTLKKKL